MKIINKITVILFIIISSYCHSQNINKDIIGRWDSKEKEIEGQEDFKTLNGEELKADISIIFNENELTLIENEMPFDNIPYKIIKEGQNQVLTFGNRRYYIDKFGSNKLVLIEDELLATKIYFEKSID